MSELEIEGTHEEQFAVMRAAVKQFHSTLYGNGQPGIVDFVSATRGQLRLIIILVSILIPLVIAVLFKGQ